MESICLFCGSALEAVEALYGLNGSHICAECVRKAARAMARDKIPLRVRNYTPRTRKIEVIIPCPSCEVRLRLAALDSALKHSCGRCGASFVAHKSRQGRIRVDLMDLDIRRPNANRTEEGRIVSRAEALKELDLKDPVGGGQIKGAYRNQCQLYHPDKVASLGKELRDLAEQKMKRINAAYQWLSE